jgi:hypothetical protein
MADSEFTDLRAAVQMMKQINDMPHDAERIHLLRVWAVVHGGNDSDEIAMLSDETVLEIWRGSLGDDLGTPVVDFEADRRE